MKLLMGTVAASLAVAAPAVAQDAGTDPSTMTCIEFIALDIASQTNVIASIQAEEATDAAVATATEADTVDEGAADGATAEQEATADAGDAADTPDAGTVGGADTVAGDGEGITADLIAACSSIPDMRVTDAMMQVHAEDEDATEGDAAAADGEGSGG